MSDPKEEPEKQSVKYSVECTDDHSSDSQLTDNPFLALSQRSNISYDPALFVKLRQHGCADTAQAEEAGTRHSQAQFCSRHTSGPGLQSQSQVAKDINQRKPQKPVENQKPNNSQDEVFTQLYDPRNNSLSNLQKEDYKKLYARNNAVNFNAENWLYTGESKKCDFVSNQVSPQSNFNEEPSLSGLPSVTSSRSPACYKPQGSFLPSIKRPQQFEAHRNVSGPILSSTSKSSIPQANPVSTMPRYGEKYNDYESVKVEVNDNNTTSSCNNFNDVNSQLWESTRHNLDSYNIKFEPATSLDENLDDFEENIQDVQFHPITSTPHTTNSPKSRDASLALNLTETTSADMNNTLSTSNKKSPSIPNFDDLIESGGSESDSSRSEENSSEDETYRDICIGPVCFKKGLPHLNMLCQWCFDKLVSVNRTAYRTGNNSVSCRRHHCRGAFCNGEGKRSMKGLCMTCFTILSSAKAKLNSQNMPKAQISQLEDISAQIRPSTDIPWDVYYRSKLPEKKYLVPRDSQSHNSENRRVSHEGSKRRGSIPKPDASATVNQTIQFRAQSENIRGLAAVAESESKRVNSVTGVPEKCKQEYCENFGNSRSNGYCNNCFQLILRDIF